MSQTKDGLTQKREAFALAYAETGNGAEAYRRAFDVRAATQHSTVWEAASRLLADSKVKARIEELRTQAASLSIYTIRAAFEEYEEARQLANKVENPSAAVAAITGKVKLFGLEPPTKMRHMGDPDNPVETITRIVIEAATHGDGDDKTTA